MTAVVTAVRVPRVSRLLAALVLMLLLGTFLPAAASPVRAAAPDLTVTSETRYDVQPEKSRVHVTAQVTAVNHLHDTKTPQFYFDRAYLPVQPGATAFKMSGPRGPSVSVASRQKDHTLLR